MNEFSTWTSVFLESLTSFGHNIMGSAPKVIGAILIFLVGWIIAKLFSSAIARILKFVKFNDLAEKVNATSYLKTANISSSPSQIVGKFAYWVLLTLVLLTASDALGWQAVSNELSKLISYLPNLLVAIFIFIIGTYIASFVRDVISGATQSLGISAGKIVSTFVFYLLFVLVTLTALRQAGIDTSIITSNMLLILGAILGTAAISYGLASRDALSNILANYMTRNIYKVGMKIEVDNTQGTIEGNTSIGLRLTQSNGEKVIIPASILLVNTVRIIEE